LVYIGSYFRKNEKIDENRFLGEVILSIPFFVCLMLLCLLPILFSFKAIGNDRTLTIVAFFVVIFVAYFSFQLGYRTLFSRKIALFFAIMCLLLLAYGARYRWTNEVYGAKIYAEHFDRTIDYLLELKAKKHRQPVGIDPITLPPGSLERNSFSADTLFWFNKDFANAYQLGYKVYSK
ncbi:MAG: hypothetical protein MUE81_21985, partial [Thermoflexibacter sp.]|nr:hypothetical protein [Thermoflexibacter sp.]